MTDQPVSFPLYPADWLGSSTLCALSSADMGLFLHMLCHAWDQDGLPPDAADCKPFARWDSKPRQMAKVLELFPVAEDGRRRNAKQEAVRAKVCKKRAAGKAGGLAKQVAKEGAQCVAPLKGLGVESTTKQELRDSAGTPTNGTAKPAAAPRSNKKAPPQPVNPELLSRLISGWNSRLVPDHGCPAIRGSGGSLLVSAWNQASKCTTRGPLVGTATAIDSLLVRLSECTWGHSQGFFALPTLLSSLDKHKSRYKLEMVVDGKSYRATQEPTTSRPGDWQRGDAPELPTERRTDLVCTDGCPICRGAGTYERPSHPGRYADCPNARVAR